MAQDHPGDAIPYSQQHVRNAMSGNGFWMIDVARSGTYEIELRRWPRELDLPMGDLVPAMTPDPQRHHAKSNLLQLPSRTVTVAKARLRVGDFDQTVPVEPDAKAVRFELPLTPGPYALQTWLMDAQRSSRGAYYVTIRGV